MTKDAALSRAQVYKFLADAFLYPRENWTDDVPLVNEIVQQSSLIPHQLEVNQTSLEDLQFAHRHTFGIAGSLCYETEYGLPHEYQQSQEMADLAGFYKAFGFHTGGEIRERPDHISVELEFMCMLALKEAYALEQDHVENAAICIEAQSKFLAEHLGNWFSLFAQSLRLNAQDGPYLPLAHFATHYLQLEANRLGVKWAPRDRAKVKHTPFDPDMSCAACCMPEQRVQIEM
jgi:putative dimethyl sulfoxide reductase chaperone